MNKDYKNYIITILIVVVIVLGYDINNKKEEIKDFKNNISKLNDNIDNYKENEIKLKDDKLFYKDLYIKLADDYNDRLKKMGIDEYILTDTSR